ncbi:MAG: gfo/Idh/MocA family oxidoreductase [Terrimonas sp.]|nr:gfo/Idh/MocA family oxidoreductase [Terrimonas sp.]
MTQTIRWGILGAGRIAHTFAKDFAAVQHASLVAVAARDAEKASAFADQYKIPTACSYEALWSHPEVDIIYIATTHNFHYEQVLQCLEHGKAVLCEKPITVNDQQLEKLMALAKDKNVFLMEAMWTWFLPAIRQAKDWINEGKIGSLKLIQAEFCFAPPVDPEKRLFNRNLAGGALLDIGVYLTGISCFFTDSYPHTITASGILGKTGVDEKTSFTLQYDDVTANLFCSIVVKARNSAFFYGEKGYIEIPLFWRAAAAQLYDSDNNLVDQFVDDRVTNGFEFEIQDATDCLLAGRKESSVVPLKKSLDMQKIMTTVRQQIGLRYPFD